MIVRPTPASGLVGEGLPGRPRIVYPRRMRHLPAPLFATLLLAAAFTTTAHGDILPPGFKGVSTSIRVDGEVPAGKVLVVAKSFRGVDALKPGVNTPLQWHPLAGKMQLMMFDAKLAPALEAARDKGGDALKKALAPGVPCGEPFDGVRTVPEKQPEAEVRFVFKVSITGAACAATQLPNELLDADGKLLGAPAAPPASAPPPPAPPASGAPSPTPSSAAPPPKSGCGACAVGGASSGWGGLAALGLAAMALGRRRRR